MVKRFGSVRNNGSDKKRYEQGAIIKKGRGLIKAALVYPNTYRAGMSSLGFQVVYKTANQIDFLACERIFLPDTRQKQQRLKSLENGLSLNQFDIILFSISFENDYNHLVQILAEAGIPLRSSDRNHTHPLVVAGGVACFLNPEPIAPFMDCFLLGEAECLIPHFFDLFYKRTDTASFIETLEKKLPGAYVPGLHTGQQPFQIKVQYLENLDTITSQTQILSSGTAFRDIFLIETLKGCPHGCRFCSAGFIYRPPRIYPVKNILNAMASAKDKTDKIGLVSSAIADHPEIIDICKYGLKHGFKLSFSSLRADKLTDEFICALSESKVKTATIAPEAGSKRMRNIINKKISENDILKAARQLVTAGILNLKLYFMIGLPFETDRDIQAIVLLTRKIKSVFLEASKKNRRMGIITLSINPFIPKPGTPFQWSAMADEKVLRQRISIIKKGLKKIANIRVNIESLRQARMHALLSRGDRKTADLIESAQKNGWTSVMRKNKAYCNYIIYHEKPIHTPLPWDFLDNRVNKQFLAQEFLKAEQEKKSPPCPMIDCNLCKTCIY